MKRLERLAILISFLAISALALGQNIPKKPEPFRFVNDFANIINDDIEADLNTQLGEYSLQTTIQIVVVTVPTLDGDTPASYAQQIGEEWGVGQKGTNNGVVILVKPKTAEERGQAFIATGYGMEETLTDAVCTRITNEGMIEYFKKNDYAGGAICGAMAVKALMNGSSLADALNADYSTGTVSDFDEDADYDYNSDDEDLSFLEILFVILFFYFLFMWPTVFIVRFLFALITKDWSSFKPRWKILFFGFWWFKALLAVSVGGGSGGGFGGGGGGFSSGGGSFGGGGGGGSW